MGPYYRLSRLDNTTAGVHDGPRSGGTSRNGTHRAPPRRALRTDEAAALPSPAVVLSALTTLQASLDAADRPVAPPKGLSTLGFDPDRFQPEPPVCYRAS